MLDFREEKGCKSKWNTVSVEREANSSNPISIENTVASRKRKRTIIPLSMFWCIDSQCLFHIFEVGYFVAQAGLKLLSPRITNGRQSGSVLTDKH